MASSAGSRLANANAKAIEALSANEDLFLDPMMGVPLPLYVDQDVEDREKIIQLIEVRQRTPGRNITRTHLGA